MVQLAQPVADVVTTGWGTAPLWSKINEGSAGGGDGTTITESTTNAWFAVELDTVDDPGVTTDHTIRMRWGKIPTAGPNTSGTIEIRQDYVDESTQGTLIATFIGASGEGSLLNESYTLTGGEAGSIDYSKPLFARAQYRSGTVDYIEFEAPDAPSGPSPIDLTHFAGTTFFSPNVEEPGIIDLNTLIGSQFFAPTVEGDYTPPGTIVSADVICHYDFRNLVGVTNDLVGSHPDESPKSQDPFAQGTSGQQPKISDSGFGGNIRCLEFDGVDDEMDVALDQTYSGDYAILYVMECLSFPALSLAAGVVFSTGSVPNKVISGFDDQGPSGHVFMVTGGAPADHITTTNDLPYMRATPSRFVMLQYLQNSGLYKVWENGQILVDIDEGQALNNMPGFKIGAREDSSRYGHIRYGFHMAIDMDGTTTESDLIAAMEQLIEEFNVSIDMDHVASSQFFEPTLADGSVDLTHFAGSQFFEPTLSSDIALDHFAGSQFFSPSVADTSIDLDHLAGSEFFILTLGSGSIDLTHFSGTQFFDPEVVLASATDIDLDLLDGTDFFTPDLVGDISLDHLAVSQFFVPTFELGSSELTLNLLDSGLFFEPTLHSDIGLTTLDGSQFFEPSIVSVEINLALLSGTQFFGLTVSGPLPEPDTTRGPARAGYARRARRAARAGWQSP